MVRNKELLLLCFVLVTTGNQNHFFSITTKPITV